MLYATIALSSLALINSLIILACFIQGQKELRAQVTMEVKARQDVWAITDRRIDYAFKALDELKKDYLRYQERLIAVIDCYHENINKLETPKQGIIKLPKGAGKAGYAKRLKSK